MRHRGTHPFDHLIKSDSIINAWCPGCGIGTTVNVFFQSVARAQLDPKELFLISGFGCAGRIIDAVKTDGIKMVTELPFSYATRYKADNQARRVVVFLSDADFIAFGTDGFVETARGDCDILVVYINSMTYRIVQCDIATLPAAGVSIYESRELPFNIPFLAQSCGARYVARWTSVDTKRLYLALSDALKQPGLSVIEVIAPCLMYYAKYDKIKESLDRAQQAGRVVLNHDALTEELDLRRDGEIVVGRFGNKD
jgi:2-oxoglutarate ferredoxin oxidoreductase subunit beta